MPFDLTTWKANFKHRLPGWKKRVQQTGVNSVYYTVSAAALWPVVEAARTGDWGAVAALGGVLAGLGSNLLANQMQSWKDETDAAVKLAEAGSTQPALRAELDAVLQKLDALSEAGQSLAEADRAGFIETLRAEMPRLGSQITHITLVKGGSAVAQGDGAIALGKNAIYIGGPVYGNLTIHPAPDPRAVEAEKQDAARRRYLENLIRDCQFLPLIDLGRDPDTEKDVTLDDVYIALDTTHRVPVEEKKGKSKQKTAVSPNLEMEGLRGQKDRPFPALEAAVQTSRLALLGDPGSGKSTFARHVLAWYAGAELGHLKAPDGLPSGLLPVLITLRDLVPRLNQVDFTTMGTQAQEAAYQKILRAQLRDDLTRLDAEPFTDGLLAHLRAGTCLLVLDGLDEVPQALQGHIRATVLTLCQQYAPKNILLTCRVRSYVGEAEQPGFTAYTLAPFTHDQIRAFIKQWYQAQARLGRVTGPEAASKTQDLSAAAVQKHLAELASNPMMLTAMAIVHQQKYALPPERVRLYKLVVEVLLNRWQKRKAGMLTAHPTLDVLLKDDLKLRRIMERLAYEAHLLGKQEKDAADLSRLAALEILEAPEYIGDLSLAQVFLDYVDQRAGLLIGRGGKPGHPASYSFPHRTFQEYLAGCYLTTHAEAAEKLAEHAGEPEYWSLAVELGAEEIYYNTGTLGLKSLRDLLYQLYPHTSTPTARARRRALWACKMAVRLGQEALARDPLRDGAVMLAQFRTALVTLLSSDLTPPERADAGRALASLGDPRPEVLEVDAMEFCFVPEGEFMMGTPEEEVEALKKKDKVFEILYSGESPQHRVSLPAFWMARYPVTNAQFEEFVMAGGYGNKTYWREAIQHERWENGTVLREIFNGKEFIQEQGKKPYDFGEPFHSPNHPVVGITWYECLAYTRWLSERWQNAGLLASDWHVTLPSEAEWEKAARGGPKVPSIPTSSLSRPISTGLHPTLPSLLTPNPLPTRRYPWGDEFEANFTNVSESRIEATSAVGCFPGGASPYGAEEMSGNVWEWTRSLWGKDWQKPDFKYPYQIEDGRENLKADNDTYRVLRGGSFNESQDFARCAYRYWYIPHFGFRNLGFRVVVSPFLHDDGLC